MEVYETHTSITYEALQHLVSRYDEHVPAKVRGLEDLRLREVPETLAKRKRDGEVFLQKEELRGLVEWKLYVP